MRTFVSWRFWLTLVALAGLTWGLLQFTKRDGEAAAPTGSDETGITTGDTGDTGDTADAPPLATREIDLVAPVFLVEADPAAAIVDGVTTASMQVRVDGFRYMDIVAGTPGENRCEQLDQLAHCVVAVDLLGEAVLWFSFLPVGPRNEITLPAVTELLEGSQALLANGWVVDRADEVDRDCSDDTTSLADFVRRFGPGSISTFSLDEQAIVAVTCAGTAVTTVPPATVAPTNR